MRATQVTPLKVPQSNLRLPDGAVFFAQLGGAQEFTLRPRYARTGVRAVTNDLEAVPEGKFA